MYFGPLDQLSMRFTCIGQYKRKMLVAVSKGTNNHILPMAYAIVEEEAVHSWYWFFQQFRFYVAQDKQLVYVLSQHILRNTLCNEQLRRMERAICISSVLFVTC